MTKSRNNSIKAGRKWSKKGVDGILACIVGPLWKGMGKSNYRKLNGRRKETRNGLFFI